MRAPTEGEVEVGADGVEPGHARAEHVQSVKKESGYKDTI